MKFQIQEDPYFRKEYLNRYVSTFVIPTNRVTYSWTAQQTGGKCLCLVKREVKCVKTSITETGEQTLQTWTGVDGILLSSQRIRCGFAWVVASANCALLLCSWIHCTVSLAIEDQCCHLQETSDDQIVRRARSPN